MSDKIVYDTCNSCGELIKADAYFCIFCGELEIEAEKLYLEGVYDIQV